MNPNVPKMTVNKTTINNLNMKKIDMNLKDNNRLDVNTSISISQTPKQAKTIPIGQSIPSSETKN